jgi:pyrroloquinoline quinone biosynthesis protein D
LANGVRLRRDTVRDRDVLLYPEGALSLNETAAAVLELCDGQNTLDQIVRALTARFERADVRPDVEELLAELARRGLVLDGGA